MQQALRAAAPVQQVLDDLKTDHPRTIEELRTLTAIPAPPFKEQKRAEYFVARLKALGLADAHIDKEGNAVGIRKGTGSHRYDVAFKGPGGHSFGAFGQVPSAIHAMGRSIAHIGDVQVSTDPKTTFTVGKVGGGTSVNTIAGDANMAIDIRSNALPALLAAEKDIMAAVQRGVAEENRRWNVEPQITATSTLIGDRPAGATAAEEPIVQVAVASIVARGWKPALRAASTDANVPMGLGIPAIILGSGGKTGAFHALGEWWDPTDAWQGAPASLTTVLALVGVQRVSQPVLTKRPAR